MNEPPLLPGLEPPPVQITSAIPIHEVNEKTIPGVTPPGYYPFSIDWNKPPGHHTLTFIRSEK